MKQFDYVRTKSPKKSVFDLSFEHKTTLRMGNLVPIFCKEVVPSDVFDINTEMLLRLAPLVTPMMHRVNVKVEFFFVPYRLIWDAWEDFITGGRIDTTFAVPKLYCENITELDGFLENESLLSYLGFPSKRVRDVESGLVYPINLLYLRAYQRLWHDFYKDQNLETIQPPAYDSNDFDTSTATAEEKHSLFGLRKRCWEKDYFTASLPTAQRGDPVSINMGSVTGTPIFSNLDGTEPANGDARFSSPNRELRDANQDIVKITGGLTTGSITINELRNAQRIQRWKEKSMRAGYRLIENILSTFGVRAKDYRLQRTEYLGGGSMPLMISEVLQTSQTDNTPLGTMAGHGASAGNVMGFRKFFEEHGVVIGLMSVMPRTGYFEGIPKHFLKDDRFEFLTPEFAHIGEQPVKNVELYYSDNQLTNDGTFGYNPNYMDYRVNHDMVTGEFADTLKSWHMARNFGVNAPQLNAAFVTSDPTNRIFAATDETQVMAEIFFNFKGSRPLPYFGEPI